MRPVHFCAIAITFGLALSACGNSGGKQDAGSFGDARGQRGNDAQEVAPAEDGGEDMWSSENDAGLGASCDPVAQNCDPDLECAVSCGDPVYICRKVAGGTATEGQPCDAMTFCAPQFACLSLGVDADGGPAPQTCKKICHGDGDCPGSVCAQKTVPCASSSGNHTTITIKICNK
jgi:hypothetical protein